MIEVMVDLIIFGVSFWKSLSIKWDGWFYGNIVNRCSILPFSMI